MGRHHTRVTAADIGRLFIVGIPAPRLDTATRRLLERLHVGGVILFRRNIEAPAQMAALSAAIHALPSQPLVAIDHEGGRVLRLGEPFTQFPPAAAVGGGGDAAVAFRVGQAMAAELGSVGIDLNFAPVLDVHSNPANPIIGDRAFSSDPRLVGEFGVALMRGLLAGGIIPCGKHFPGHGDTATDSHCALPVVQRTRAELECTELVPFRAAIAARIPMLMTAHVLYPALDATHPATVARTILTDLLRTELCFEGVIVSDDLEMRAIADHQDLGAAAVATVTAGADALLVCQDLRNAERAVQAVAHAIADGSLPPGAVLAAARRLQRLRQLHPTHRPAACELPNAAHRALARSICAQASA
jgi:beta-N-acetylhexosaminidase